MKSNDMEKEIEIRLDTLREEIRMASANQVLSDGLAGIRNAFEELREVLITESDSKRGPEEERKQIIELRHWSEHKTDYIDAIVCGVNCDCSDLECKFKTT